MTWVHSAPKSSIRPSGLKAKSRIPLSMPWLATDAWPVAASRTVSSPVPARRGHGLDQLAASGCEPLAVGAEGHGMDRAGKVLGTLIEVAEPFHIGPLPGTESGRAFIEERARPGRCRRPDTRGRPG